MIFLQKKFAETSKQQIKNVFSALGRKPTEAQMNKIINFSHRKLAKRKKKKKKR